MVGSAKARKGQGQLQLKMMKGQGGRKGNQQQGPNVHVNKYANAGKIGDGTSSYAIKARRNPHVKLTGRDRKILSLMTSENLTRDVAESRLAERESMVTSSMQEAIARKEADEVRRLSLVEGDTYARARRMGDSHNGALRAARRW